MNHRPAIQSPSLVPNAKRELAPFRHITSYSLRILL
jgi:hypothetical protein